MTPSSPDVRPPEVALSDVLERAAVVRLPLRTRFRGVAEREAVLLRGPAGWGEFAPFLEYGPTEAARWLAAALESAWTGSPPAVRDWVEVNATVPAVPAAQVRQVLARYDGCTTVKVKVAEPGQGLADDVDRVRAVREVLGPAGRIRVDANAAWSLDEAERALRALAPVGLEYAEQPCADLADLARLRVRLAAAGVDVLLAADESIRKAEDPLRVAAAGAADVVVLKVAPLGGIRPALAVAQACGLPVVVSSALDTSVGIAAGVALAAALPELPFACGLGTAALLAADVTPRPWVPVAGRLPVGAVEVDGALLAAHAAPGERADWWRRRIADCWEFLPRR
ncbi:O-succinylbenzoate synthase [Kineococcus xinjiangensis]|uniref:o-succinylbenzoate synthase n=1 Tax=Kineococcus xinjiangensis TaxID=512762 RepID=A0A2S6IT99_9ACTN|nr:o-succinylbenzoate synthase [Kineococcus xinjiangensis]PPK97484.1 O-succinylbenzoate synthase [Kineococcus xinjiangensis]